MGYEVCRKGKGWGVVFRVDAERSFDQRLTFKTKRAAVSAVAALTREWEKERNG